MAKRAQSGPARYSIAAVSKLTGIGCHALRAWERRYGFPVPARSPSGHRRYEAAQVAILGELARRHGAGEPLPALMAEARSIATEGGWAVEAPAEPGPPLWSGLLDRLLAGDLDGADSAYFRVSRGLDIWETVRRVIHPGLIEVGERWFRGECDVFQEHAASDFLRRKLSLMVEEARALNTLPRRVALIGTLEGDRHEGGVLMLALALEMAGWRAQSLGVDLPAAEYQSAIDLWRPDVVCLSLVLSRNVNKRFDELAALRGAPIYLGGRSVVNYVSLARRHGLHPLAGPCEQVVPQMIEEVERSPWRCDRPAEPLAKNGHGVPPALG